MTKKSVLETLAGNRTPSRGGKRGPGEKDVRRKKEEKGAPLKKVSGGKKKGSEIEKGSPGKGAGGEGKGVKNGEGVKKGSPETGKVKTMTFEPAKVKDTKMDNLRMPKKKIDFDSIVKSKRGGYGKSDVDITWEDSSRPIKTRLRQLLTPKELKKMKENGKKLKDVVPAENLRKRAKNK